MRLIVVTLAIFLGGLLALTPSSAFAYDVINNGGVCSEASGSAICQDNTKSKTNPLTGSGGLILKITRLVAIVAGIAAVLMIIVSGFRFITSAGDPEKASGAKRTLIGAIIGIVIIAMAEFIIEFVVGAL